MARLQINDAQLECTDAGIGEPLVFVHGSASDLRTWQAQRHEFARHYRVITYSRRYHWPNQPITAGADYSMTQHLDDLAALLRTLDAAPAHIVGHSYGAFLGLLLAIRDPTLVRTLVLAEPPVLTLFVSNSPRPHELLRLFVARPRTAAAIMKLGIRGFAPAAKAARKGNARAAMRVFGRSVLGPEAFRELSTTRLEQVDQNAFAAEFLGSGFLRLHESDVRAVTVPTLLVSGQRSPAIFHRLAEALAELIRDARRAYIPGASHLMHEDDPSAYNQKVLSFLAEQSRS